MRVLLVVAGGPAQQVYEQLLREHGLDFDAVESLTALHDELARRPYNGILLDVPTMISAGADEKALTHDMLEIFPALRLSYDAVQQRVRAMYYGQTGETGNTLQDFIRTQVAGFAARTVRRTARKRLLASVEVVSSHGRERTAVIDLSAEGCFVITASPWREGEGMSLMFPGALVAEGSLADIPGAERISQATVPGICRRVVAWGPKLRLPGIGVRFEPETAAQEAVVNKLLAQGGTGA